MLKICGEIGMIKEIKLTKEDYNNIRKFKRERLKDYVEILLKSLLKAKILKEYTETWDGIIVLKEDFFNAEEVYINLYGVEDSGTYMFNLHCDGFYFKSDDVVEIINCINELLGGKQ